MACSFVTEPHWPTFPLSQPLALLWSQLCTRLLTPPDTCCQLGPFYVTYPGHCRKQPFLSPNALHMISPYSTDSIFNPSSLIATLHHYCPRSCCKRSLNTTPSSFLVLQLLLPAQILLVLFFSPPKWNRFFVIPTTAAYSDNTHFFQQCFKK